ncbi:GHKL domain-containing protein [Neglecta sp. X4]|uniref:sensor histidine kinase n=1 Tax=unclassified Neglectibacter TaxID=2632164 RepID=UPI00136E31EB|nr:MULTISPECIES: GHKL domain-containing protein [unclassified Neglectibacter]NBI16662.1 GHKL domain-containing protein [Neglectibacter sp. 59]NBJ72942.1 GHKL domain-containing protein [Neglectibacter sp. X4]NCE80862.1 GHKL domain-containing protein [Neglectibacter sp. X58]
MAEYLDFFNIYVIGLIEGTFQFYFLAKILKKKLLPPFYFLFGVCAVIVTRFLSVGTVTGFVAMVFLLTVCGILVCHADFKSSLLYAALTTEIMLLCYGIVKSLIGLLYAWLPNFFYDTAGIAAMLASEAASLLLTGVCYYMVYRYFSDYTASEMQQMFLVFIPILMIFIMSEYINMISFDCQYILLEEDGSFEYLFSHWQLLVMHLLGLLSLFCILFFYRKLQQNFRLSTEISLLEQEEHSLNQYVEEAKTRYDETKSFRHDIRNHIAVVKNLLQSGKLEEAVSYMEDMDDMAEKMSFPCSTNNPVVDILVGNKLGIAKSMGIDVDCSLLLPYPCSLKDIDICIILSNALDNAIQAVKRLDAGMEKYIHVSGRIQGDFLMMEIENSFHGKGAFKKGTGLSNVKKVAEKYGGAMSIETQENKFVLHVLLIISQHPEGIPQQMD